jgi:hypothetical protein
MGRGWKSFEIHCHEKSLMDVSAGDQKRRAIEIVSVFLEIT